MNKLINQAKEYVQVLHEKIKAKSFFKMSIKDQTFFIKRLSFLTKAGIPILESLTIIREQTNNKNYVKILDVIITDVSNGQYLSKSLEKFQNIFGDFSINIISFGESSGILSENLSYLAEELKKKDTLRKKVIGAFIYPAVITLVTILITGFLMIYLFPKIMPVFGSLHISLPFSTKVVIFFSNFFIHHGVVFIFIVLVLIFGFIFLIKKTLKWRFYFDKFILYIPIIGNMIKNYNLANFTRTMGLLLKSGIHINEALSITSKISSNVIYKLEFTKLIETVNTGAPISAQMSKNKKLFPDILTQIIAVGERSGNLSNSFLYLAELYENEVEEFTKNLSSLIEPALMIVMGILVGFIAVSIITPIYSITQNIHS